jgi:hypothetical protein
MIYRKDGRTHVSFRFMTYILIKENLTPNPSPSERGAFVVEFSPLRRRGVGGEV